ncbi:hypothetical protein EMCRGX_G024654 [Ephydatia muelleri]
MFLWVSSLWDSGKDGRRMALAAELSSAPGKLIAIKCDMSKEEDILQMFQTIKEQHGGLDVCINNAALSHIASILEGKTCDWREMFEVNVLGPCICIREAVKQMKERKVDDGHIILINSVLGHKISPLRKGHFYSLTKHAITTLTEIVRQELREDDSGIRVTSISPGLTRTEFYGRMHKLEDIEKSKQEYDKHCKDPLEPEDIAEAVVVVLSAPSRVEIHELTCRSVHQEH